MQSMLSTTLIVAVVSAGTIAACADTNETVGATPAREATDQQVSTMKIRIQIEGTTITATLADNATSRDFVSLLPLSVTLKDYAATEKIVDLPKRLSTEGAPAGAAPSIGDITYYAPWGNLAIFHKDFDYSKGLIKLGTIDSNVEALSQPGPIGATIELVK